LKFNQTTFLFKTGKQIEKRPFDSKFFSIRTDFSSCCLQRTNNRNPSTPRIAYSIIHTKDTTNGFFHIYTIAAA